jgi:hypothetical protein
MYRPWLSVADRCRPVLRAGRGHGPRGLRCSKPAGDGHQLGRRVRLVLDDHPLVGKPPRGGAAAAKPTTPCLQSRSRIIAAFSDDNHAGRGRRGIVRECPLGTGHDFCEWHGSGTADEDDIRVARQCRHRLDHWGRADRGDACLVGKGRRPAAAVR